MKHFLAAVAGATLLAASGAASAQMMQPMNPAPMQMPVQQTGAPPWMQDDHSSSVHPVPMPGDVSGDRLNAQYRGGIHVPPGQGLPADWDQR